MTPGEVVAGYRLLEPLGEGGEGQVFLAESTDGLGKRVALKRYPAASRARFEAELEAYRRIEAARQRSGSAHLAEGIAAGDLPDGGGFVALAYQPGGTLADRVRAEGPLDAATAARVTREVLEGLALLHAEGLCHRDVKPSNVLLGADGEARLGDFGLSRARDGTVSTGGTPAFAAPEQWVTGDDAAARSGVAIDVYGAGATLYFLLTGRSPLPGRPDLLLLEARKVPRPLQRALLVALAPDPARRFPDADALRRALDEAVVVAPAPPHARPVAGRVVAALALLTAVGGAALLLGRNPAQDAAPSGPRDAAASVAAPEASAAPAVVSTASPASPGEDDAGAPEAVPANDAPGGASPVVRAIAAGPDGPAALLLQHDGREVRVALEAPVAVLLPLDDGRVVAGTADGQVVLVDPARPDAPRALHRFAHRVLALTRDGAHVRAEGDGRRPLPLADGEAAPPGARAVEGALGRYAWPTAPAREVILLILP
ncbi:MAG: protein kinase [Planctomycetes bacterium]|nr:protein kinase [Planctomycetota bacterium]